MPLRFLTAGDSHGESLTGIIEGLPAGIRMPLREIRRDLRRRRRSHGRSARQKIEEDRVSIRSGLWRGRTTGAPLAIQIPNLGRTVGGRKGGGLGHIPRPGHADLAGCQKYSLTEIPPIAERASARSTAMRVAIGAIARVALQTLGVELLSHVRSIGEIEARPRSEGREPFQRRVARSPIFCADPDAARDMIAAIDQAAREGHSLGGSAEVIAIGVPPGLGSHVAWDRKLDARLAGALMSIQSVKVVEIGAGLASARRRGVDAQDAITLRGRRFARRTNFAGGIEGGISNGEEIVARVYAKPIPTAPRRVPTVDLKSLRPCRSPSVRADVCVVPALAVIAEAVTAWVLLGEFLEKFGGDHITETDRNRRAFLRALRRGTHRRRPRRRQP